jgi:hypothetical protein
MEALMALIMEFDESNADMLFQYLQSPSYPPALIAGVDLGVDDYAEWADTKRRRPAIRWRLCFE